MTGALRVVAGTGDNAGRLVVERVDGATSEQLFIVSFDEAGTATVQGINSAAFLGTDTVTNVNSGTATLTAGTIRATGTASLGTMALALNGGTLELLASTNAATESAP